MKFLKIILGIYLILSSNAFANIQMNNKMVEDTIALQGILQEIMLKTGKVSRADYEKFWGRAGVTSSVDKERVIASTKKSFVLMQEYTKEIWICAEKAWLSSKKLPCTKANEIIDRMKKLSGIPEQQELYKLIEKTYDEILNAAANKTPLKTPQNSTSTNLSLESIKIYRKSIEESLEKINKILSVDFVE